MLADSPAHPQSAPQAAPAASPQLKTEQPQKKEEGVRIRPNFLLCALFQAVNILVLVGVLIFGLWMVKNVFRVDVIETVQLAFSSLAESSDTSGGIPLFGVLLHEMQETVVFAFIEIVVVAFILQIPVANKQWKIFPERLEYRKGFILLRTKAVSFSDVKSVSFKRYTSLADFGKVIVEFSGHEGKSITMPYVYHAARLTAELNDRLRQHQLKEAAELAKKTQAQASPAGGQAAATPASTTSRPGGAPPQGP